ncbi:hypothetical protein cypCar_00032019 [Cyprinus carpio]|nr:hypothetical protein cypCar_00032019 [Cyprinus carpio]
MYMRYVYESHAFSDILLWDFEDTFFNLTQWVSVSYPKVKLIFKGDADVYVNIDNMLEMLEGQEVSKDLFVGDIIVHAKPIRRRNSKYYVPDFIYGQGLCHVGTYRIEAPLRMPRGGTLPH